MSSMRVMPGILNMEGKTVNTLQVGQMVSRHPRPRYETTCEQCGTRSTESQDRLVSGAARCLAANCGKPPVRRGRDLLSEQRELLAKHEDQRLAEEREISERKMEAETLGYERPLSVHEVAALRARRKQEEPERLETERLAREKAERDQQRIAELRAEQEDTLRQLVAIQRDRIAAGRDDEFVIDPATIGEANGVPPGQVAAWHQAQFAEFLKVNPDYYRCDENAAALATYIERNAPGLVLLSAAQLTAAYKRLNELGLLKQRPAPAPQLPVAQPKRITTTTAPAKMPSKPLPVVYEGWDEDGNPRQYTEREVSRWSSEEMKRRLRLTAASGALSLPTIGPGPLGRSAK